MRASVVIPSEAEIAIAESAMRDGLDKAQKDDLDAYAEREKAERLARARERQARYDRERR